MIRLTFSCNCPVDNLTNQNKCYIHDTIPVSANVKHINMSMVVTSKKRLSCGVECNLQESNRFALTSRCASYHCNQNSTDIKQIINVNDSKFNIVKQSQLESNHITNCELVFSVTLPHRICTHSIVSLPVFCWRKLSVPYFSFFSRSDICNLHFKKKVGSLLLKHKHLPVKSLPPYTWITAGNSVIATSSHKLIKR